MMTARTMKRTIAVLILAAFVPVATTGCFGSFQLTRKVYQFNRDVSPDKWIQELTFLVMAIIPVYGAATFLDAVIFNSIEFWTGNNPVLAENGATQTILTDDGMATLTRIDEDTLEIRTQRSDGREDAFRLTRDAEGFAAHALDGALLARVGYGDPALRLAESRI